MSNSKARSFALKAASFCSDNHPSLVYYEICTIKVTSHILLYCYTDLHSFKKGKFSLSLVFSSSDDTVILGTNNKVDRMGISFT